MTLDEAARSQADRAASKNNITVGDGVSALSVAIGHSGTLQRRRLRELIHQIDLDKAMRRRSIQQAILQAESWFWAMRAEQFHAAAPRPGDFNGDATAAQLAGAAERCRATAQACLDRAAFVAWQAQEGDLDVIEL
jgi:hypothetical protein